MRDIFTLPQYIKHVTTAAPGAQIMEQVVEQRGHFILLRGDQGFAWAMTGVDGQLWYWHPGHHEWNRTMAASISATEAASGLGAYKLASEDQGHAPCRLPLCRPSGLQRLRPAPAGEYLNEN